MNYHPSACMCDECAEVVAGSSDNSKGIHIFGLASSQRIKELEEKLAVAQKSLVDYETDWVKMRKYYDGAMEKMAIAIEALEEIWDMDSQEDGHKMCLKAKEALEKIKRN